MQNNEQNKTETVKNDLKSQVVAKIDEADNILVALSRNPSVDDLAAAIGLTLFLDKIGKHATAIFSGEIPNVLQFLDPEKTFDTNTDGLQDFIIALNKDKADHLRYKIDGDYVKVFITPYRTTINEKDLEFSYGDYNIDLIIALNVSTVNALDAALSEHGKIMHDAATVNITTGRPGRFGEVEWSEPTVSSVSEMIAEMLFGFDDNAAMSKDVVTALLAGIVSATHRFSNEKTTPNALKVASSLMQMGADQQLVAANLQKNEVMIKETKTVNDEQAANEKNNDKIESQEGGTDTAKTTEVDDPSLLTIERGEEKTNSVDGATLQEAASVDAMPASPQEVSSVAVPQEAASVDAMPAASSVEGNMQDVVPAAVPEVPVAPAVSEALAINNAVPEAPAAENATSVVPEVPAAESATSVVPEIPVIENSAPATPAVESSVSVSSEVSAAESPAIPAPVNEFAVPALPNSAAAPAENSEIPDYEKLIEQALAEPVPGVDESKSALGSGVGVAEGAAPATAAPATAGAAVGNPAALATPEAVAPPVEEVPQMPYLGESENPLEEVPMSERGNSYLVHNPEIEEESTVSPAESVSIPPAPAPTTANVENPLPMPSDVTLPPAPNPPVDFGTVVPPSVNSGTIPVLPDVQEPVNYSSNVEASVQSPQPAAQTNPDAFQIPGIPS